MAGTHGLGFVGLFLPQEKPSFLPFAKSFAFLNICQSQDVWDLHFTRGFSAPAMLVFAMERSTRAKKKKVLFVNLFA